MTPMPFAAPVARALLRSQSDERLVRLARDGHKGAFDEIVRRYRAPLVAFSAAYAPAGGAEDVVQESLTSAWASLQDSQQEIALKPWLYAIVRNRSLNARRDARYHDELDETIDGVRRPDEIVLQREELSRAVAAVVALPDPQRKALVESAIEGRTHDQIAAELGTTAGSVRGLIHRGRVAARGALGSVVPAPVIAWAAGAGGTTAVGGVAAGSIAGGSLAATGAAVATIAVLATGSGLVDRSPGDTAGSDREASAENKTRDEGPRDDAPGSPGDPARDEDARGPDDDEPDDDDDNRNDDDKRDDDGGADGPTADSDRSDDDDDDGETRSDDGNSGSGGGEDEPDTIEPPDDSGSGSSGGGSSGSGDDDFDEPDTIEPPDDSGSGSSGGGSSGSGDDDFDEPDTIERTDG
jgi:RNA polymerase sigma factor (sigma-70 family)